MEKLNFGARTLKIVIACTALICMIATVCMPLFTRSALATDDFTTFNSPVSGQKINSKTAQGTSAIDLSYVANCTARDNAAEVVKSSAATYYYGDVNNDKSVNTGDASLVLKYAGETATFDELQLTLGDANHDKKVNTGDASYILCLSLGIKKLESISIESPSGSSLTIIFNDPVNRVVVRKTTISVEETTTFNAQNITLPTGYKLLGEQSQTVAVTEQGVSPSTIEFNVYGCKTIDGVDYVTLSTTDGIMAMRSNLKLNYIMVNDIDMAQVSPFVPIGWSVEGQYIIYSQFTGIFDGNGYKLDNLNCDWWNMGVCNVGFIAINAGTIKNLWIDSTTYSTTTDTYGVFGDKHVGVIAGSNAQGATIENCHVYGSVGSSDRALDQDGSSATTGGAGGITGMNVGTVVNCSAYVGAEGFYWVGGLVGKNFGAIDKCWFAGGINSLLDGEFLYNNEVRNIGGIAGGTMGNVTNSYVLVLDKIQASNSVGGMFGWVGGGETISNIFISLVGGTIAGLDDYGLVSGYVAQEPAAVGGLYNYTNGVTTIPAEFSELIWDMNGESYNAMPDIISNRRPADWNR